MVTYRKRNVNSWRLTLHAVVGAVTLGLCVYTPILNAGGDGDSELGANLVSANSPDLSHVTDTRTRTLLMRLYAMPDLLSMAKENVGPSGDPYPFQEQLRKEYDSRKASYRASMPYRHRPKCKSGDHTVAAIQYTLVDPAKKRSVEMWESDLHEVLFHGAALPHDVAVFLEGRS